MKKNLLSSFNGCLNALRRARQSDQDSGRVETQSDSLAETDAKETEAATRRYLLYFMLPLWIVPGFLDYLWHRRTKIETTSGTHESMIHSLMMTETGIPVLMGLLLEIDAGVLLTMLLAFFAHWATAFWDVNYATTRREVRPNEQHIHSFLEVLPFCAVSFAVCLHWGQFLALFGKGPERARFWFRPKQPPLSTRYVAGLLSAVALGVGAPYAEELWRCWKNEQKGLAGSDTPAHLREKANQ